MAGGDETPRFEAFLYLDGVKAAMVSNGGTGGCNHYHWFIGGMREQFAAYAKAQNPTQKFEVEDSIIYKLMDDAAFAKKLKRWCATKTVARLPGESYHDDAWTVFKVKFTPQIKAQLEAKYPGIKFANEGL